MGGYAALLFGSLLGATMSISIVPQTSIYTDGPLSTGDQRFLPDWKRIAHETTTPCHLNIADTVARSTTDHRVIFGRNSYYDCRHADKIATAPSVSMLELSGADHDGAARFCLKTSLVDDLLRHRLEPNTRHDRTAELSEIASLHPEMKLVEPHAAVL